MSDTPIKQKSLPGGFPQFKRHLAAIHRMPPTHAPVRPFHASDVVYAMLRHGVGKQLLRRAGTGPSSDAGVVAKAKGTPPSFKKLTSNSLWGSVLKRPY